MIDHPVLLVNQIQDYAWGSRNAIQELVGDKENIGKPWAEMWMGAHPKAPSKVTFKNDEVPLDNLVSRYPEQLLGPEAARRFDNTLPFLFKVLAAEQPLSIQAHPDKAQALEGFERENDSGIPLDAPHRNYRDPWPKPEIICAIEPFVALNGFRSAGSTARLFETFCPTGLAGQIRMLGEDQNAGGIKNMFAYLLGLDPASKDRIIAEALENARNIESPEGDWVRRLHRHYPGDIGVLSPLFLELVRLEPYTAMFLSAGRLHAYLEGVGIELMANSDNVLRGGLTGKHMDAGELMRIVHFEPSPVEILRPVAKNGWESLYPSQAEEFTLSIVQTESRSKYRHSGKHGLEILLCMKGRARFTRGTGTILPRVEKGQSVLIPAGAGPYEIEGEASFFKASIPGMSKDGHLHERSFAD